MATHATTWWGVLSTAATAVSVGDAVVPNDEGKFLVATTANRASYGRSRGVAISAASAENPSFEYQVAGILSAEDSGIATGDAGDWVVVDTNGDITRVGSVTPGDDVIGRCPHTSADVQVMPGVWDSDNTSGGAGIPGGANTQLQYNDGGAFGGDAGLTYNETTNALSVAGSVSVGADPALSDFGLSADAYVWSKQGGNEHPLIGVTSAGVFEIGAGTGIPILIGSGLNQYITVEATEWAFDVTALKLGAAAQNRTLSWGSGAPASSPADGSVYFRTDGDSSTGLYTRQSGAWSPVGGGNPLLDTVFNWTPTSAPDTDGQAVLDEYDTNDSTEHTAYTIAIPDETMVDVTVSIMGRSDDGDHFGADDRLTVERTDGTPSDLRTSAPSNLLTSNPVGWVGKLDRSGNDVRVRVKGAGNVRWSFMLNKQSVELDAVPAAPFDIASMDWNGLWMDSYTASPWPGTASAGTSGAEDLTEATNPPSTGTNVDGVVAVNFDGTNDKLGNAGPVATTFIATTEWATFVMFRADAAFTSAGDGSRYNSPCFWCSDDSVVGVGFDNDGINVHQATSAPAQTDTNIACATGAWHVLFAWWDGTNLHLQLDDGSPITEPCASQNGGATTAALLAGVNYAGTNFFDGQILAMGIKDTEFSGTEIADIYGALQALYPSASLP